MSNERLAELENALGAVREALSRNPECDRYGPDEAIVCGWKRAVGDITATLDALDGPWATVDERKWAEARYSAMAAIHDQPHGRQYSVAEVKQIIYALDNAVTRHPKKW